jgi:hypothetical protein
LVAIPAAKAQRLSFFMFGYVTEDQAAQVEEDDENNKKMNFTPLKSERVSVSDSSAPAGTVFISIHLKDALQSGKSTKLSGSLTFTRTLRPVPAEISQAEAQLVLYEDSLYVYSPYKSAEQSTQVRLASSKVESFTRRQANQQGDVIQYGPFNDVEAFATAPLSIHYENQYPFVTARTLRKAIEVSHWGNINVEESYLLEHSGAKLKVLSFSSSLHLFFFCTHASSSCFFISLSLSGWILSF